MNLATVVVAAHNEELTRRVVDHAFQNFRVPGTLIEVFDNGVGFGCYGTRINIGNYGIFFQLAKLDADVILVLHNDVLIYEAGYDVRLLRCFGADPNLGLVGFVASNEVDFAGGRGLGTVSNFQGKAPGTSAAEVHGARDAGFRAAAIVDGCAMAFRKEALAEIPEDSACPPHHFYDKKFSMEMLSRGWHVGYLGIEQDHLSGQTANVFEGYHQLAEAWCEEHGVYRPEAANWDHQIYLEAEHQFLVEWRDQKRFFPLKVGPSHEVFHLHPQGGPVS